MVPTLAAVPEEEEGEGEAGREINANWNVIRLSPRPVGVRRRNMITDTGRLLWMLVPLAPPPLM